MDELGEYKQSSGTLIAHLFFYQEERRINKMTSFEDMDSLLWRFGMAYKSVGLEMFFKAELTTNKYYKSTDFDELCIKCIDFSVIKDKLPPEIEAEYRPLNRIKSLYPLWAKGIGKMTDGLKEFYKNKHKSTWQKN